MRLEIISDFELLVHFHTRPPLRIYSSDGEVLKLWNWMQSSSPLSFSTYKRAVVTEGEATCPNITLLAA